jgi:hypothetical protein
MRSDYALVVGLARPETGWLLGMLDESTQTLCRGAPDAARDSPLAAVEDDRWCAGPGEGRLATEWDAAAARAARRMGDGDPRGGAPKRHVRAWARGLRLDRALRSPRVREALAEWLPYFGRDETPFPRLLASPRRLAEATALLELAGAPGWAAFVLRERPAVPVLHVVRHPAAHLEWWTNVHAKAHDADALLRAGRASLHTIAERDPRWALRFGDIDQMSPERAALCHWLHTNEVIADAGRGRARYTHVHFEDLVERPIDHARRCFDALGLGWSVSVRTRILARWAGGRPLSDVWRKKLDWRLVPLVEEFIALRPRFYTRPMTP